ncbi:MAG: NAD(P)-dependent glycerol-3-phosphate dehydrogenase [Candidatus Omnitrophica bacterium]|nr:NAD(P)-dependent glycerol-3-phosphate dehydrogenase [Candidatus Omnitrophota bacterium]
MTEKFRVTVLGDGGWGTALAVVNARRKNDTVLWSAFPDYAKIIEAKRENVKFLPGVPLSTSIRITTDLKEAVQFGQIIVLAIPTQFLRNILHKMRDLDLSGKILVSVAKGIEKKTCLRPSEIIHSALGAHCPVVVLSGPSHAEEVARNIPTLVVAASKNEVHAIKVQQAFMDTFFRIYVQSDVVGVELGGALKNVIAIAAGVCDGLEFGDNTKSGLISRGLFEMTRIGIRMGANPNTFFGLSGLGDLVTTCFSKHGRNLRVGYELGQGKKIGEILSGMQMVAEGVDSAESVHELCQKVGLTLPILNEVYLILFKDKDAKQAVQDLLHRDAREEWKQY